MKRLIIVRHAKAVNSGYSADYNRELADKGIADADKVSKELSNMGITPDMVFSSSATRALQTAIIFCDNLGYQTSKIKKNEGFYYGLNTEELIHILNKLPDEVNTVFVFGHNPTVYYWIYNLSTKFEEEMPTCSTVALDFPIDKWANISARNAEVAFQITPK